jgi:hypothetical protein
LRVQCRRGKSWNGCGTFSLTGCCHDAFHAIRVRFQQRRETPRWFGHSCRLRPVKSGGSRKPGKAGSLALADFEVAAISGGVIKTTGSRPPDLGRAREAATADADQTGRLKSTQTRRGTDGSNTPGGFLPVWANPHPEPMTQNSFPWWEPSLSWIALEID